MPTENNFPQPGTPEWLSAAKDNPVWRYADAQGVVREGFMQRYIDLGGTDHLAYMYRCDGGRLDIVSGSRLKTMQRIK